MRLMAYFSLETTKARRQWNYIVKVLKEKDHQSRTPHAAKLSFKNEGEIKAFTDLKK